MSTRGRVVSFVVAVVVAFLAAFAVGRVLGDPAGTSNDQQAQVPPAGPQPSAGAPNETAAPLPAATLPAGLRVSDAGYTLAPITRLFPAYEKARLRFTVVDYTGAVVKDFRVVQQKKLHLVLVRRDLTRYQHVHPTVGADGVWSADVTFPAPGTYRMLADMAPVSLTGQDSLVLGADLFVSGRTEPESLGKTRTKDSVAGLDVELAAAPVAGVASTFTIRVTRDEQDGGTVDDLQPFLGAFGHLVALREGDLAYVPVQAQQRAAPTELGGPRLTFRATLPTPGKYALFFDFQHDDSELTADFVTQATQIEVVPTTDSSKVADG